MRSSQQSGAAPRMVTPSPACRATRGNLMAYIDGELDEQLTASVAAHLCTCAQCQHADRAMRHLIAALRGTQLPVLATRQLRLKIAQLLATQ